VWLEREKQDAVLDSVSESEGSPSQKPWLKWKPTPKDPSVKPWLWWNANMDNGDVENEEQHTRIKRIRTHVMGACSRFASP